MTRKLTIEEMKQKIAEKHNNNVTLKDNERTYNNRYTFIDVDFGEYQGTYNNVVRGLRHPQRSRQERDTTKYTKEQIQALLDTVHNGTIKIKGEYSGMLKKCLFEDIEFGEFTAYPSNVIHNNTGHIKRAVKRRKQTSIQKYGHTHPMQNEDIYLKCVKSNRKHLKILHWKTNKILHCINSWEYKTVEWFNLNKIDFDWQPKAFKMPSGKTYRPDAYIKDWDIWIDIKGYYPEHWREKCEWFKSIQPNFELWFKERLYQLGIL